MEHYEVTDPSREMEIKEREMIIKRQQHKHLLEDSINGQRTY